jgi:divalent metal cation (Fe/Co/Zn/Cd) transporter
MPSSRAATAAVFVAGVGLLTLALNAIAVPKSPTFQTIGACLLLAGVLAALLLKRRQHL